MDEQSAGGHADRRDRRNTGPVTHNELPANLASAEISDIDLDAEEFHFQSERLTEESAARIAERFEQPFGRA